MDREVLKRYFEGLQKQDPEVGFSLQNLKHTLKRWKEPFGVFDQYNMVAFLKKMIKNDVAEKRDLPNDTVYLIKDWDLFLKSLESI